MSSAINVEALGHRLALKFMMVVENWVIMSTNCPIVQLHRYCSMIWYTVIRRNMGDGLHDILALGAKKQEGM